jgi:signal transduction histidine kinase
VNKSFLQIIGIGVNLILNKQLESLFQDPERIRLLLKSESTVHSLFDYKEHWLKGGTENRIIPVEVRVLHVTLEQEFNRISIIIDITENKENEARIMHAVISSEEEERKRIAQDLHDGIGPYLSAAKMYIDALAINEQSAKELRIKKELYELLQLSIHSIREIAGNLGAQVLRTYGLYTALNKFIEKIHDNFKINFELLLPEKSPFIEKVETALYRILVELINTINMPLLLKGSNTARREIRFLLNI